KELAKEEGVEIKTTLLSGKPFEMIIEHAQKRNASMIFAGRKGIHAEESLDIGATAEAIVRGSHTSVYISTTPALIQKTNKEPILWSKEAEATLKRIPPFIKGMAVKMVEESARKKGIKKITEEFMKNVRKEMGL
ncbi:MAG: universal stress protein, partial [Deltaproteobacteria bacterium]|nr:universal stress protein [Deltaproteobacteria bacterium]